MAACFQINCTNVLSLACKGAAILEINKRMMKTDNIRKLVWTNYIKTGIVLGRLQIFFFFMCKTNLQSAHFLTVDQEIGNITFCFLGLSLVRVLEWSLFWRQQVVGFISLTIVLLNPDIPWLCKQCRSRSVGFWRSQLIWIYSVCY